MFVSKNTIHDHAICTKCHAQQACRWALLYDGIFAGDGVGGGMCVYRFVPASYRSPSSSTSLPGLQKKNYFRTTKWGQRWWCGRCSGGPTSKQVIALCSDRLGLNVKFSGSVKQVSSTQGQLGFCFATWAFVSNISSERGIFTHSCCSKGILLGQQGSKVQQTN